MLGHKRAAHQSDGENGTQNFPAAVRGLRQYERPDALNVAGADEDLRAQASDCIQHEFDDWHPQPALRFRPSDPALSQAEYRE